MPVHASAVGKKIVSKKYAGLCFDGLNEAGLSGAYLWDTCESRAVGGGQPETHQCHVPACIHSGVRIDAFCVHLECRSTDRQEHSSREGTVSGCPLLRTLHLLPHTANQGYTDIILPLMLSGELERV